MLKTIREEEFYEAMKNIYEKLYEKGSHYNEELSHIDMDDLMCELLTMLGYGRAVKIFQNTPKWYS